jgi:heme-degrading monooxygenase HmoA
MFRKSLLVILGLVITVVWIGTSYAQESAGPILRILTYKAAPGKQEELLKATGEDVLKLYAGRKGLQWYRIYYDPSSGEMGTVTIWDSQTDIDAFVKSDARKATVEKRRSLIQGDISTKVYQVYEPKK